jgi:hypothetical protein
MLVPSADRFLGVADLRLCNGETWKERVKVCLELFASATASERVAPEGERNSIQANNCSFGYAEFNLVSEQHLPCAKCTVIVTYAIYFEWW